MSQSEARAFNQKLCASVERGYLPLTPMRTARGMAMAAIRGGMVSACEDSGWDSLTTIVAHPSGRAAIETHTRQWMLDETGVHDLIHCVWHCRKYVVGEDRVLTVGRRHGIPEQYDASDMFSSERHAFGARLLRRNIENEYSYLMVAQPQDDVFAQEIWAPSVWRRK